MYPQIPQVSLDYDMTEVHLWLPSSDKLENKQTKTPKILLLKIPRVQKIERVSYIGLSHQDWLAKQGVLGKSYINRAVGVYTSNYLYGFNQCPLGSIQWGVHTQQAKNTSQPAYTCACAMSWW